MEQGCTYFLFWIANTIFVAPTVESSYASLIFSAILKEPYYFVLFYASVSSAKASNSKALCEYVYPKIENGYQDLAWFVQRCMIKWMHWNWIVKPTKNL